MGGDVFFSGKPYNTGKLKTGLVRQNDREDSCRRPPGMYYTPRNSWCVRVGRRECGIFTTMGHPLEILLYLS